MAEKGRLVLLDFDGTLFFTDKSVSMASKDILGKALPKNKIRELPRRVKSRVYELGFSKYRDMGVPNGKLIDFIKQKRRNANIMVLTARFDGSKRDIIYLLKKGGVPDAKLVCRRRAEMHMHDEDWKASMVKSLAKGYKHVELFEDKLENIRHIKSDTGADNIDFFLVRRNFIRRV